MFKLLLKYKYINKGASKVNSTEVEKPDLDNGLELKSSHSYELIVSYAE